MNKVRFITITKLNTNAKNSNVISRLMNVTNTNRWYQHILNCKGDYEYWRQPNKYCKDCKSYTQCNCLPF